MKGALLVEILVENVSRRLVRNINLVGRVLTNIVVHDQGPLMGHQFGVFYAGPSRVRVVFQ